jgi:nicotinate dehydrogenase subunit A
VTAFLLSVNGNEHQVDADPDMPLLYALRGPLALRGPRFGCGLGQCGACTVILDGQATRSCITPISAVGTSKVLTLDGIGTPDKPHPVQTAFIAEQAAQCGHCISGWLLTAVSELERNPKRSDQDLRDMFSGLKCRCATHMAFLRAARRAADTMADRAGARA